MSYLIVKDNIISQVSADIPEMLGMDKHSILQMKVDSLLSIQPTGQARFSSGPLTGKEILISQTTLDPDGQLILVELHLSENGDWKSKYESAAHELEFYRLVTEEYDVKLAQSDRLLGSLEVMINLGLLVLGEDFKIEWANQAACDLIGSETGGVLGKQISDIFPLKINGNEFPDTETIRIQRKGQFYHLLLRFNRRKINVEQTKIICIVEDITDIIFHQKKMSSIFELSEDFFGILNQELRIIELNRSWIKLGIDPAAIQGERIVDYFPHHADLTDKLTEIRASTKSVRFYNRRTVGQQTYYLAWSCKAMQDQDYIVISVKDISGLVVYQRELQEKNKQLNRLNHQLDKMIYHSSHSLRSPVTTMKGLITLLDQTVDQDQLRTYHRLIGDTLNKMEYTLNQVAHFAQIRTEAPQIQKIDLLDLLEKARQKAVLTHDLTNFDISFDLGIREIQTDGDLLQNVLDNIMSNSICYADPQKERKLIKVSSSALDGQIQLTFWDNGLGIEPEHQERVFEMFYRASNQSGGAGLGLFTVKQIVDHLEGKAQLQSQRRRFTEINIILPA